MSKKTTELRAEGFTVKSCMKNAVVAGPPSTGVFQERPSKSSVFRKCYNFGDLPVKVDFNKRGRGIAWKVDIEQLDYNHYLPLFFEGLCETDHPLELFACQGIHEMLECGGSKILPVIPHLIQPISNALNTRNDQVMCNTMKVLQHLVQSADKVGEALVPYFRQILPVFNLFKNKKKNLGGETDYSQQNIAYLIEETLRMFERYGGHDAFANIKYMVPTYQSCMKN